MLEIASWSWSNFLSYGDYVSTVDLDSMNQCFITGIVESENGNNLPGRSNGAGKSSIIAALQWALFGRTSHNSNPGDKVINHYSKNDCWVKVVLTNGDSILRTRRQDGSCEVVYYHSGCEQSIVADTLSTLKAQQSKLNQVFKLDWDVFSKSVFFSVFDKSWMQMPDQQRKKVLERLLKLDRFEYYAKSAANRTSNEITVLDQTKAAINDRLRFLNELSRQIENQKNIVTQFEIARSEKIRIQQSYIDNFNNQLLSIPDYDLSAVKQSWDDYYNLEKTINSKINDLRNKKTQIYSDMSLIRNTINRLTAEISSWESFKGKICASCGQLVADDHIHSKINPKSDELEKNKSELPSREAVYSQIDAAILKASEFLSSKKPSIAVDTVKAYIDNKNNILKQIEVCKNNILIISSEPVPVADSLDELNSSINRINSEIDDLKIKIIEIENKVLHLEYIKKAYSDRNKIKSYVLANHIPFINERLDYYLDVFGLDVKIRLNNSLGIDSNSWGYDFQSSGERRRTDVAMMLATYDMHEQLYGRQCNVLVLDEVDGQMDQSGIDSLIHIIKNDLSMRIGTTFVISHRDTMQNVFGSEIIVRKRGSFSYLEK